jgi:hypothetical protein
MNQLRLAANIAGQDQVITHKYCITLPCYHLAVLP